MSMQTGSRATWTASSKASETLVFYAWPVTKEKTVAS